MIKRAEKGNNSQSDVMRHRCRLKRNMAGVQALTRSLRRLPGMADRSDVVSQTTTMPAGYLLFHMLWKAPSGCP